MARRTKQAKAGAVNSARLAALLDNLVAVDLDLEALSRAHAARQTAVTPQAVAEARDILRSAIADLRNIISQIEALTAQPGAARQRRRPP
jgi:hypothetical protein